MPTYQVTSSSASSLLSSGVLDVEAVGALPRVPAAGQADPGAGEVGIRRRDQRVPAGVEVLHHRARVLHGLHLGVVRRPDGFHGLGRVVAQHHDADDREHAGDRGTGRGSEPAAAE